MFLEGATGNQHEKVNVLREPVTAKEVFTRPINPVTKNTALVRGGSPSKINEKAQLEVWEFWPPSPDWFKRGRLSNWPKSLSAELVETPHLVFHRRKMEGASIREPPSIHDLLGGGNVYQGLAWLGTK